MPTVAQGWERCVHFHGHECPGLAIGLRIALAAMEELGMSGPANEELRCIAETRACGVDAVQLLTGCTYGKGSLVLRDRGKAAFSFFRPGQDRGLRIAIRHRFNREAMSRQALIEAILTMPSPLLLALGAPSCSPPAPALIFTTIPCDQCGELASEQKMRLHQGRILCLDCVPTAPGW